MNRRKFFIKIAPQFKKSGLATLFYDTFTDTDGVSLPSHTPDINLPGNPWVNYRGPYTCQSNKALTTQSGGYSAVDVGLADVIISALVATPNDNKVGIFPRYAASNSSWVVCIEEDSDKFRIYEYSGVFTLRAETDVALTAWTQYTMVVTCNGSTISGTIDGANEIAYASATRNQSSTIHGIRGQNLASTHDNFQIIG